MKERQIGVSAVVLTKAALAATAATLIGTLDLHFGVGGVAS